MNSRDGNMKNCGESDRLQHEIGRFDLLNRFVKDLKGITISIELVLVAVVLLIGMLVGLTSVRDSIVSELADVAGSVDDLNQSFTTVGVQSGSANVSGSDFLDATDSGDAAEDVSGLADQGILFDVAPSDESGPPSVSDAGTYTFTSSGPRTPKRNHWGWCYRYRVHRLNGYGIARWQPKQRSHFRRNKRDLGNVYNHLR